METGARHFSERACAFFHSQDIQPSVWNSPKNAQDRWKRPQQTCIWVFCLFAPVLPPFLPFLLCSAERSPALLPVLDRPHFHSLVLKTLIEGLRCLVLLHQ